MQFCQWICGANMCHGIWLINVSCCLTTGLLPTLFHASHRQFSLFWLRTMRNYCLHKKQLSILSVEEMLRRWNVTTRSLNWLLNLSQWFQKFQRLSQNISSSVSRLNFNAIYFSLRWNLYWCLNKLRLIGRRYVIISSVQKDPFSLLCALNVLRASKRNHINTYTGVEIALHFQNFSLLL